MAAWVWAVPLVAHGVGLASNNWQAGSVGWAWPDRLECSDLPLSGRNNGDIETIAAETTWQKLIRPEEAWLRLSPPCQTTARSISTRCAAWSTGTSQKERTASASVGTTGESPTVSFDEHCLLIRTTVEQVAGRVQ